MFLPVGMKVIMSEMGKQKWKDSHSNPHNIYGVLNKIYPKELSFGKLLYERGEADQEEYFGYSVVWSNGISNVYRYGDLSPAISLEEKKFEDYL